MGAEDQKYIEWLERMYAEHVSKSEMGPGDLRRRLGGAMTAARALREGKGELFGMNVGSMPPPVFDQLAEQFAPRFSTAVTEWREWLEAEHGAEGLEVFAKIGENAGYVEIAFVPLSRDPAVDAALNDLETALQRSESVGYFFAPPSTDASLIQDMREDLPPQVAGLYAALDTIDIFTTEDGPRGRASSQQSDYVLIEPLASVEVVSSSTDDAFWTLHVHDMGRFLCFNAMGELWSWDRYDPTPVYVAPDVATYLRALAAKYR